MCPLLLTWSTTRHVPWLGKEQATLWLTGQHSINWATQARACLHPAVSNHLFMLLVRRMRWILTHRLFFGYLKTPLDLAPEASYLFTCQYVCLSVYLSIYHLSIYSLPTSLATYTFLAYVCHLSCSIHCFKCFTNINSLTFLSKSEIYVGTVIIPL